MWGTDKLIFWEGDTKPMGVLPSLPPTRENPMMGTWPINILGGRHKAHGVLPSPPQSSPH